MGLGSISGGLRMTDSLLTSLVVEVQASDACRGVRSGGSASMMAAWEIKSRSCDALTQQSALVIASEG